MYNNKLELKVRRQRIRIKSRRLSSHKIFVSKGEFKHTNDRVMINIYIYNRQKYNYFYKIKNKYIYYNNIYIDKLLKKSVKRQMLYIYYKRLLLFNKLKFRYTYLNKIINLIKKIYNKKTDSLNKLLYKIFSKHKIKKIVINSIKNKTITGVRLETAGRLSKRHTASRSLFKLRYKGSLKNIDSTYKKLSSKMIRGTIKSNIQYTKLNSIARIGSFGVKG